MADFQRLSVPSSTFSLNSPDDGHRNARLTIHEAETRDWNDDNSPPQTCHTRADDIGFWNFCKAWYLAALHTILSVLLVVGIICIDNQQFQIGAGPSLLRYEARLYQAQVTALISLALVLVRLAAGSCSLVLAWRTVLILLETRGISLPELSRLVGWRIPVHFAKELDASLVWSVWAIGTIVLMWSPGFASPVATSSVTWIPGFAIAGNAAASTTIVQAINEGGGWSELWYEDGRMRPVIGAAAMTARDPTYAFNSSGVQLRRYFNSTEDIPDRSLINMTVPYMTVDLQWINASSDNSSAHAGTPLYSDVDNQGDFGVRTIGATSIIRDQPWNSHNEDSPAKTTYNGTQLVAVKLRTMNSGDVLPDGTRVNINTTCPTVSEVFGQLPHVEQYRSMIPWDNNSFAAWDCYILARAHIIAGAYSGKNCPVVSSDTTPKLYATCRTSPDDQTIEGHYLTTPALDFVSEVLKYSVLLNYTQPWISGNLDDYTAGMLTMGYHAAWSRLMADLGDTTETANFRAASPIVSARIDKQKLYIWLGMNLSLTLSALLVWIAQVRSRTKTIRDPALAALTLDLSEVAHSDRCKGLCDAVTLSHQDHQLPRLRISADKIERESPESGISGVCRRRVVFVDDPHPGA